MEVELELVIEEADEIKVLQKLMDLAGKAKELGFSIKELEMENKGNDEEDEESENEE